jgi:hypothetical protein
MWKVLVLTGLGGDTGESAATEAKALEVKGLRKKGREVMASRWEVFRRAAMATEVRCCSTGAKIKETTAVPQNNCPHNYQPKNLSQNLSPISRLRQSKVYRKARRRCHDEPLRRRKKKDREDLGCREPSCGCAHHHRVRANEREGISDHHERHCRPRASSNPPIPTY